MGLDLQAKAVNDSKKIFNGTLGTGGFNVSLKFTDLTVPTPQVKTIQGFYNDTSLNINPETGFPMIGSKLAVSFHQSDLTIWDGIASLQRWKIELVNGAGQTVLSEIESVAPDRSFGDILVLCKIISGHN